MLMHSCCCILFIGMTGFDPNAKRIQKSFENEFGKSIWKKKRNHFPLPPFLHFRPAGPTTAGPLASLLSFPSSFLSRGWPKPQRQLLPPPHSSSLSLIV
jgi:hypothetical protein